MRDETREVSAVVFGLRHLIVNAGAKGLGTHSVISRQIAFPPLAKSVLLVSEFSSGQRVIVTADITTLTLGTIEFPSILT